MSLEETRAWVDVASKALLRIERYASEHNERKMRESRDPERSMFLRSIENVKLAIATLDIALKSEITREISKLEQRFEIIVKDEGLIIPSQFCKFITYCNRKQGIIQAHLMFGDKSGRLRRSDERIDIPPTQTKVWDILQRLIQSPEEWNPLPEGLTLKNTFKNGDGTMLIYKYIHSRPRPGGGAAKDYSLKDKPFL